jgi:antitoxin (DNA-binding transcriptional repressor) of toxin-antitoxin stability system
MKASVMDLRYRSKEILKALKNRQRVELTYRGRVAGTIIPPAESANSDASHPAIGMWKDQQAPVPEVVRQLRQPRFQC